MWDNILIVSIFLVTIALLWIIISIRYLNIEKKKYEKQKGIFEKTYFKKLNLLPLIIVSIEKFEKIKEELKNDMIQERSLLLESFESERNVKLNNKILELLKVFENHPMVKKSGYFLELSGEIQKYINLENELAEKILMIKNGFDSKEGKGFNLVSRIFIKLK